LEDGRAVGCDAAAAEHLTVRVDSLVAACNHAHDDSGGASVVDRRRGNRVDSRADGRIDSGPRRACAGQQRRHNRGRDAESNREDARPHSNREVRPIG
jgi:hypothetical protein